MMSGVAGAVDILGHSCGAVDGNSYRAPAPGLSRCRCRASDLSVHSPGAIHANCNTSSALDEIYWVPPGARIVKDEVIEYTVIKHRPKIRNWRSHNNHVSPHDNKHIWRNS
jgi:hypothetical protein